MFILIFVSVLSPILSLLIIYLILKGVKISNRWIKYLDYWIGFYAFFVWGGVASLGLWGSKSMVNAYIEPLYVLSFSIFMSIIKFLLFKFYKNIPYKMASIFCNILIIIFAVLLGLFCPTYPE